MLNSKHKLQKARSNDQRVSFKVTKYMLWKSGSLFLQDLSCQYHNKTWHKCKRAVSCVVRQRGLVSVNGKQRKTMAIRFPPLPSYVNERTQLSEGGGCREKDRHVIS